MLSRPGMSLMTSQALAGRESMAPDLPVVKEPESSCHP